MSLYLDIYNQYFGTVLMNILIEKLSAILDHSTLLLGSDISDKYHADWSGADPCAPPVLLRPKTTVQLSQIMAL